MKKIHGINDWQLDKKFPDDKRFVDVSIHLKYTDVNSILKYIPGERIKKVNQDQKDKFKQLIKINLFGNYELIGTLQKPRGVKTKIAFSSLKKLEKIGFIGYVFINKIDKAKKTNPKPTQNYYCVKMTVAIEIEGRNKGLQTIEERFVIIKANSFENAYGKLKKKKDNYYEPYLNSDGQLVRWKIESFDDCYETDINGFDDLNNPEGIQVYSKLRTRRLTKERLWDGNSK